MFNLFEFCLNVCTCVCFFSCSSPILPNSEKFVNFWMIASMIWHETENDGLKYFLIVGFVTFFWIAVTSTNSKFECKCIKFSLLKNRTKLGKLKKKRKKKKKNCTHFFSISIQIASFFCGMAKILQFLQQIIYIVHYIHIYVFVFILIFAVFHLCLLKGN